MAGIKGSVGKGGKNEFGDVVLVQLLLNHHIAISKSMKGVSPLVASGSITSSNSDSTVKAILAFQRNILGYPNPAGRVDPGGKTIRALQGAAVNAYAPRSSNGSEESQSGASSTNGTSSKDDTLPIEVRVDRVIDAVFWEAHNPSVYPDTTQRRRLLCLLAKMKSKSSDDKYIPHRKARSLALGTTWAYPKYSPDDIAESARSNLRAQISRLPVDELTNQEAIRTKVLWLYYEIERSLTEIASLYGVHGDSRGGGAAALHRWAYDRQQGKTRKPSILACFTLSKSFWSPSTW